jgi:hypothetical protein
MTWIRNPWWDGFWILSGLPIGLCLALAPPQVCHLFFTAAVVLETGHVLSPIVLTWTHKELRWIATREWPKWILLPAAMFASVFFLPSPWDGSDAISLARQLLQADLYWNLQLQPLAD